MKTKQEPAPTSSLTDEEAIRYLQESKLLTPVLFNSPHIREIPPISYQKFVLPEIKRAFISGYDLAYQRGRDAGHEETCTLPAHDKWIREEFAKARKEGRDDYQREIKDLDLYHIGWKDCENAILKSEADVRKEAVKEFCEKLEQTLEQNGNSPYKRHENILNYSLHQIREAIKEAHTCPAGQDADKS